MSREGSVQLRWIDLGIGMWHATRPRAECRLRPCLALMAHQVAFTSTSNPLGKTSGGYWRRMLSVEQVPATPQVSLGDPSHGARLGWSDSRVTSRKHVVHQLLAPRGRTVDLWRRP